MQKAIVRLAGCLNEVAVQTRTVTLYFAFEYFLVQDFNDYKDKHHHYDNGCKTGEVGQKFIDELYGPVKQILEHIH